MSLPVVPSDFYTKLSNRFDSAKESGDLLYMESTKIPIVDKNIRFVCTYAPALAKKPENSEKKPKIEDPFMNPDPELVILKDFGLNSAYYVQLNKFAVEKGHFLLITKAKIPQSSILSEPDIEAAYGLLKEVNKQSGKRHVAFYNCGKFSGASIDHKHVQFMALPDKVVPLHDNVVAVHDNVVALPETVGQYGSGKFPDDQFIPFPDIVIKQNPGYKDGDDPLRDTNLPINHYIVPVPVDYNEDPEMLHLRFSAALSRAMTVFVKQQRKSDDVANHRPQDLSYNVVFCEEWVMIVPRRSEKFQNISINSLGVVGLLMAKTESDLKTYLESGPINVLGQVAYPYENIEFSDGDHDLMYTRY